MGWLGIGETFFFFMIKACAGHHERCRQYRAPHLKIQKQKNIQQNFIIFVIAIA